MGFNRMSENPTLPDEHLTDVIEEEMLFGTGERKTELNELILSLNCKLDELALVNNRLFELIGSCRGSELGGDEPTPSPSSQTTTPPDVLTEPVLIYRLSSLLDLLRQWYDFEYCGVFLLNYRNAGLDKLVSSAAPPKEGNLQEFEDEIKQRWSRGDFVNAVSQQKRTVLPTEKKDSLLVIPFKILNEKEGLWVARLKGTSLQENKLFSELPFWVELISFCIENSHLKAFSLSPPQEKTYPIETERLLTTAEISRAAVHEMNNHLQVILGRTQLLRINEKKNKKTPPKNSVLETIEKNINQVCSTLKDFSDHLRRQFSMTTERGEVNLRRLLESNFGFLKYILKSKKMELKLKLEDELPSVYGNPGEIELALLSLILGLRDELPSGGSIRLQAAKSEDLLCLRVCCVSEETKGGKLSKSEDLNANHRLGMVSRILSGQNGELRIEKFGEDEIILSLRFPIIPDSKAELDNLQGLSLRSPESHIQAGDG